MNLIIFRRINERLFSSFFSEKKQQSYLLIFLYALKLGQVFCQTCGPKVSPRLLKEIPCDLSAVSYCTQPGSAYPWSSVRRYIFENQGFVKRMYGEQRQSQVIQQEIDRVKDQYQILIESNNLRNSRKEEITEFKNDLVSNLNKTLNIKKYPQINDSNSDNEEIQFTTIISTTTADVNKSYITLDTSSDNEVLVEDISTEPSNILNDDLVKIQGFNACPITQEVVAPYWANNTRGETLALLNVYPFEQYIHWEKCKFEKEQMFCRNGCRCEQQYRLHRLLAFDPKNECRGIFADWFRFPGCCVCVCYDDPKNERINSRKARL